jgi:hypothetical protein
MSTRTVHMLSDAGSPLEFTALDDRSRDQLLIDAGAFASRLGNLHAQLVSLDDDENEAELIRLRGANATGTRVCPHCDAEQTHCSLCHNDLDA